MSSSGLAPSAPMICTFILTNQFGQLNTHFGGTHGAGQGNIILPPSAKCLL
jgi:hypothetical protein